MNIIKSKRFIVTILTFVMFMVLARLPLPAMGRRGSTVVLIMTDGSLVKGELLAVKANALLIYDQDTNLGKSIDLGQVTQVKVLKKSKFLLGFAIGFGVLFGPCLYGYVQSHGQGLLGLDMIFGLSAIPGLCGGIIGALASADKKLSLAEKPSQAFQKNLKRLKRYARELDFAEPADPE